LGPYKLWHHTHEFKEENGGTLMIDRIIYQVPLGIVGDFLVGFLVKRDLEKIFNYRRDKITQIFGMLK
jgi:ligand-binding SRPBCC domain-containing protein